MPHIHSPTVAVIFLHPACNMTCSFCITEDNFDAMTISQAYDLLGILKKEGFESIVLGGGEPFEWPGDLLGLTKSAKAMGFLVQIGTNAVGLGPGDETWQSVDRFVLPLESHLPATHNKMRFYKNNHFQIMLETLRKMQAVGKCVTLSTIITKVNQSDVHGLGLFLKEFNNQKPFIHAWHLYKFLPQGRGGALNFKDLMVSDEEYKIACTQVKALGLPFNIFERKDMYHSKAVDFFWFSQGQLQRASTRNGGQHVPTMRVPLG